jgi:hypothetical protein
MAQTSLEAETEVAARIVATGVYRVLGRHPAYSRGNLLRSLRR